MRRSFNCLSEADREANPAEMTDQQEAEELEKEERIEPER